MSEAQAAAHASVCVRGWSSQEAGGGLVFWHPKGATIRKIIEDFWKDEHIKQGYQLLYTPHMANLNLWKTSGTR